MSTRVEGMDIRFARRAWSTKAWWLVVVAAFAVAASVVGASMVRGKDAPVAPSAPVNVSAYQGPISGTGPGLTEYAKQSGIASAYHGPVTGTGPGLAEFAGQQASANADPAPAPAEVHARQLLR